MKSATGWLRWRRSCMRSARKPRQSGGSGSTAGGPNFPSEPLMATPKLRKLLEKVFDSCREGLRRELDKAEYERRRFDFAFHMTDWLSDLERLKALYEHPE